ncbi:uncharacterized protein LOC121853796 [Homarus americanus]|nr:uncharacterized protein LOC121853796 [Homarus americanus]XP_042204099.1 uncharacterized protein LOC121853796 [Homarus americanus]
MDMLSSANSVILSTKSSMDSFSTSILNLADSVGTTAFLVIMAGAMAVSAGIGGLSFTGIARVDEYFGWPLWSSIFPRWREQSGVPLQERDFDNVGYVLKLLKDAFTKYRERRHRQ